MTSEEAFKDFKDAMRQYDALLTHQLQLWERIDATWRRYSATLEAEKTAPDD